MALPPLVTTGQVVAASHINALRNFLPLMADGTAGTPGLRFEDDPDTGLHRPVANQIALVTGGAVRVTVSDSAITLASGVSIAQDAWTNATMASGFTSGGAGVTTLAARKNKEGRVVVEGWVERGAGSDADGTQIATLPTGFYNAAKIKPLNMATMDGSTPSASYAPGVLVFPDGSVKVYGTRSGYTQFYVSGVFALD